MRKIIIDRINKIKADEDNFKSEWWEINFVSYTSIFFRDNSSKIPTNNTTFVKKHISEVDFNDVCDEDLVRLFEYVIRCQCDISINRVNKQYFNRK